MALKMKGAVLRTMGAQFPYATSKPLTIMDITLQPPRKGEVMVRVRAAGLCHSDLSVISGNRPRPMPMVLGHEAAGEVVALGDDVVNIRIGDHVVFTFVPICGHCISCMTGRPALCETGATANGKGILVGGGMRLQGSEGESLHHHLGVSGFAEYAVVSVQSIVQIDSSLPFEIAALFGCAVLTGVGAVVNSAKLTLGQSALVTGLGGIGFAALLGARAAGAGKVVVADIDNAKLAKAVELGADVTVNTTDSDALEQVLEATNGGVDIGMDFTGVIPALEFTYMATARGGVTVTAGLPHPEKTMHFAPAKLVAEERAIKGSYLGSCVPIRDVPAYISLYQAGRLPVEKLLTHTLRLDEINEGFDRLATGKAIRQVIVFD